MPFRLRVSFLALPGLGGGKEAERPIFSGRGTYDECWVSAKEWRREVTFGPYHVVETRGGGVRTFQATSDYEPSRVLMLLDALLSPIPRNVLTPELNQRPVEWNIRNLTSGEIPYVLVSGTRAAHIYVYAFLSNGLLFRSGRAGLIMNWQKFVQFGGRFVPARIQIAALGVDLLEADVSIESLRRLPADFSPGGSSAEPGMTLRPLHWFDVNSARLNSFRYSLPGDSLVHGIVQAVIDRHGQLREVEVINGPRDKSIVENLLGMTERDRWHSPTIDNSPCEEMVDYIW